MTSGWIETLRIRGILVAALLLPGVSLVAQEPAAQAPKSIRVEVDRVNVGVIVTDAKGNFVEGLGREDFQILESSVVQPITDFAPVDTPAEVLLLLEAGPAVYLLEDSHLFLRLASWSWPISGTKDGGRIWMENRFL